MALPVQARTETIENGVKTVRLTWTVDTDSGADRPRIALGRTADALVLVAADKQDREERFDEAYLSSLSVLVSQDPYPGFTMSGKQMIWVSHSPALSDACVRQMGSFGLADRSRTIRRTRESCRNSKGRASSDCEPVHRSRFLSVALARPDFKCPLRPPHSVGSKIKQGLVELPLAEVTLDDTEMIQQCAKCGQWETSDTSPRYKRCSKCKRRYYVGVVFVSGLLCCSLWLTPTPSRRSAQQR